MQNNIDSLNKIGNGSSNKRYREYLKRSNGDKSSKILAIFLIVSLIIFLVLPIGTLFLLAFQNTEGAFVGLGNFKEYLVTTSFKVSLKNSILVAGLSTTIAMVLAFLYAYAIERSNIKGKKFFNWIALLPIFAPTMTHGIALIYLFGNKGLLRGFFGEGFSIYGFKGIVISEVIYIFPVLYTVIALGLRKLDSRLYEAAEMMQTSKLRQLLTITIPGIKLSLITSFFTAFTMAFTDFGAAKIIGGNFNVLATEIYKKILGQQNLEMGAVIGIILIVPTIIVVIFNMIENKRNKFTIDSKAIAYKAKGKSIYEVIFYIINSLIA
ncbi:MAG: ABC transporter permease subunit, partial [Sarcina sp.]